MSDPGKVDVVGVLVFIRDRCIRLFNNYFGPDCTMTAESWQEVNTIFSELDPRIKLIQTVIIGHAKLKIETPIEFRLAFHAVLDLQRVIISGANYTRLRHKAIEEMRQERDAAVRKELEKEIDFGNVELMCHMLNAIAAVVNATQFVKITGEAKK